LLLSAVLRRCYRWEPGGRRCRLISPGHTALSSKPAARRGCGPMMGQTDGRTLDRFVDPASHCATVFENMHCTFFGFQKARLFALFRVVAHVFSNIALRAVSRYRHRQVDLRTIVVR